jgi:hypothetical protein
VFRDLEAQRGSRVFREPKDPWDRKAPRVFKVSWVFKVFRVPRDSKGHRDMTVRLEQLERLAQRVFKDLSQVRLDTRALKVALLDLLDPRA